MAKVINPLNRKPDDLATVAYRCSCICYTYALNTGAAVSGSSYSGCSCNCQVGNYANSDANFAMARGMS